MDLWIRTQNNKILKVRNIQKNFNSVIAITKEEGIINLGEYATEERVLEVLDEIQNHLENQDTVTAQINTDGEVVNQICYKKIFEMPKE